jgi:hypothetical protein
MAGHGRSATVALSPGPVSLTIISVRDLDTTQELRRRKPPQALSLTSTVVEVVR